jgi:hypothetical protein
VAAELGRLSAGSAGEVSRFSRARAGDIGRISAARAGRMRSRAERVIDRVRGMV